MVTMVLSECSTIETDFLEALLLLWALTDTDFPLVLVFFGGLGDFVVFPFDLANFCSISFLKVKQSGRVVNLWSSSSVIDRVFIKLNLGPFPWSLIASFSITPILNAVAKKLLTLVGFLIFPTKNAFNSVLVKISDTSNLLKWLIIVLKPKWKWMIWNRAYLNWI